MRVVLVNPVRFYGGGEKRTLRVAHELRRAGHGQAIFGRPGSPLARPAGDLGLSFVGLPFKGRPTARAVLACARQLRKAAPDVVVSYTQNAINHVLLALPFARLRRRPALVFYHSAARMFEATAWNRWIVAPRVTRFVSNARATSDELRSFGWLPEDRLTMIYNGLDAAGIRAADGAGLREELGAAPDDLVLLTSGRLVESKGYDMLLRAFQQLAGRHHGLHLWLAGDGAESGVLRTQARSLGLEGRVRFLGFRGDVPRLLHAADIMVHPSRREGAPNAVLEAMSAGLPVVGTRVDGVPEYVVDYETGLLCDVDDAAAFAANVERLVADADLRRRMGVAGRERVDSIFTEERSAENWLRMLEELVRDVRNGR